jgi:hypothetical protein
VPPISERESSGLDVKRAEVAVVASVTPVRAISCVRAEHRPVPPEPRTKAAAAMGSELEPLAAASERRAW